MQNINIIKCVVTGESGVGKSSILIRYANNQFDEFQQPTLGAAFISKTELINSKNIKFQVWDTAGQQKYQSLAPIYYRQSQVALLVYDITNQQSFTALNKWLTLVKQSAPENIMIVIIGNKTDRVEQEQVPYNKGKQFADNNNAIFKLTSAKQGQGIQELFITIGTTFYQRKQQINHEENIQIQNMENHVEKKKKCC